MCGKNPTNSREHKYKKSDLKFFLKNIDDSVIQKTNRQKWISGSNSSLVKYGCVLCKDCNNEKSKTIDNAYDSFSKLYIRKLNKKISNISFQSIIDKLNIYRFLTKNFCCRLSENNIEISEDLIEFVNNKIKYPKRLIIEIYSNYEETEFVKNYLTEGNVPSEVALFGKGILWLYSSTNKDTEIDFVYSTLKCNNLIFEFFFLNRNLNLQTFYDRENLQIIKYSEPDNLANRINKIIKNYV